MSNYCPNCGSKTYQNSLFCETCGLKLTSSRLNSRNKHLSQSDTTARREFTQSKSSPRYSSTTPHYPYRGKSNQIIYNPQWSISTSTGSVNFDLFHEVALNSSLDITYDISTSTGSVTCTFGLNGVIGYYLDASTSLGDIMAEGFSSEISFPYSSETYFTASLKYILLLSVSTGSIEIDHESL